MKDSSGSYSNPTQIATKFNYFFANVGPSSSFSQITYREFLIGHYAKCFYLNPTSPTVVANVVHSLKNSKCEGFDGLCISPIKDTIDLIAAPLTHICNLSFSQGVFTDKLKTAKILPIFKCDDSSLFSNYRPPRVKYLLEFHGNPWKSMEFHGNRWKSMEFHGTSMEYPWSIHGFPWNAMEFHGVSMEFHGMPWSSMEYPWNSMECHGVPRSSMK